MQLYWERTYTISLSLALSLPFTHKNIIHTYKKLWQVNSYLKFKMGNLAKFLKKQPCKK